MRKNTLITGTTPFWDHPQTGIPVINVDYIMKPVDCFARSGSVLLTPNLCAAIYTKDEMKENVAAFKQGLVNLFKMKVSATEATTVPNRVLRHIIEGHATWEDALLSMRVHSMHSNCHAAWINFCACSQRDAHETLLFVGGWAAIPVLARHGSVLADGNGRLRQHRPEARACQGSLLGSLPPLFPPHGRRKRKSRQETKKKTFLRVARGT